MSRMLRMIHNSSDPDPFPSQGLVVKNVGMRVPDQQTGPVSENWITPGIARRTEIAAHTARFFIASMAFEIIWRTRGATGSNRPVPATLGPLQLHTNIRVSVVRLNEARSRV